MSTNFTPIVQIVTWFLLITCSLAFIARGVTEAAVVRSINLDNFFICVVGKIFILPQLLIHC